MSSNDLLWVLVIFNTFVNILFITSIIICKGVDKDV